MTLSGSLALLRSWSSPSRTAIPLAVSFAYATRAECLPAGRFEGAPRLDNALHTFLVLDGQQRLTSLYQAFYGVGEHRYYIDLRRLIDGADFDEAIFHVRSTTRLAKRLTDFDTQARELTLPLSVLKSGSGGFLQCCCK